MAEAKRLGDVWVRSIVALGLVTLLAAGCAEDLTQPSRVAPPAFSITAAAATITVTDLGTVGGGHAEAHGVNKAGEVAGYSYIVCDPFSDPVCDAAAPTRAFRWKDGAMTDLGTFGGPVAWALSINLDARAPRIGSRCPSITEPLWILSSIKENPQRIRSC